jgi:maleate isomerase
MTSGGEEQTMTMGGLVKIGVLVPQGDTVHEREFDRLRPEGVQFKFLGFSYPQGQNFCADLIPQMTPALEALNAWGADLVLVGCTTASMMCGGPDFTQSLETISGAPVLTAADAARQVIATLGLKIVSVATPYGTVNNKIVERFLTKAGVKVAALEGLDLERSVEAWVTGQATLTPERVLDLSLSADRPEAQALYLPCTGMGSLEAIDRFEAATGKPAFSSVQAGYWASLRHLGIRGRQDGAGRLLSQWDF